jgi:hypothetical protein
MNTLDPKILKAAKRYGGVLFRAGMDVAEAESLFRTAVDIEEGLGRNSDDLVRQLGTWLAEELTAREASFQDQARPIVALLKKGDSQ